MRRQILTGVLALAAVSCSGPSGSLDGGATATARGNRAAAICRVAEFDRVSVRLAGRDVYVDPQVLLATDTGFLLAGSRTYEWTTEPGGPVRFLEDGILGVVVRDGRVVPIPRPPEVRFIGGLRAASAGEGRWAFLIEELDAELDERGEAVRVWSGVLGPNGWSDLRPLPMPDRVDVWFHAASDLIALDGASWSWTLPITIPFGRYRVLHYEGQGPVWRFQVIDSSLIETTVQYHDDLNGLWTGLVGLDPDLPGLPRTFRLYDSLPAGVEAIRAVVTTEDEVVHEPRITASREGLAIGWVTRAAGASTAWSATLSGGTLGDPTRVEGGAVQSIPVTTRAGHVVWIVHRAGEGPSGQALRFHMLDADGASTLIGSLDHPYTGYFAAAASGSDELLLVGPAFDSVATRPTVRSLVLRLSVSCT